MNAASHCGGTALRSPAAQPEDGTVPWTNSLFDQPWWLDTVAPDAWDSVVVEEHGQVVARLPYTVRRRRGFTILTQPALTPALGPWTAPTEGKHARRLELETRRLRELIVRLPSCDLFLQNFRPGLTGWLPFHWAGFSAAPRCTYRIEDLSDLELLWTELDADVRSQIRRARTELEIRDEADLATFLEVHSATLRRKGAEGRYGTQLVRRVEEACKARECRMMLLAVDADERVHAAVYVVHDERTAYYLMGGRDEAIAARGATSLLLWEAIERVSRLTRAFDFEGSMIESLERFFRSFGARQVPYLQVRKASRRATLLLGTRDLCRTALGRPA